jgi:hypothetical protein
MTQHSQNGWPVLTSGQLKFFNAAGGRFAAANSDVAYVAQYLITRFDSEVEKIHGKVLDDWSWNSRKVRGSATVVSNHASATAWDLNATKHPRGVRGTFSAAKLAAVHKILSGIVDSKGHKIFRWGNDYVNATIDSMHFEINANATQVKQARARLVALKEEAEDMKWTDKVALTAVDAVIWGKKANGQPFKQGDLVTFSDMVRYPTLARKSEKELQAFAAASAKRDAAIAAQLTALTKAVAALAAGSAVDVSQAFTDGMSNLQAEVAKIDTSSADAIAADTDSINADTTSSDSASTDPTPTDPASTATDTTADSAGTDTTVNLADADAATSAAH